MVIIPSPYREEDYNKFTERGWLKIVIAMEQRNSSEGMSQLELVGGWTVKSDEESSDDSEQNSSTLKCT